MSHSGLCAFAEKWKLYDVLPFHLLHVFTSCEGMSDAIILWILLFLDR